MCTHRIRSPAALLSGVVLGGAVLVGCGGSNSSKTAARNPTAIPSRLAHHAPVIEDAKVATASCKRAVTAVEALPAQSKSELAAVCDKISGVILQDRRLIAIVCSEVANASAASDASARSRSRAACLLEGKRRD